MTKMKRILCMLLAWCMAFGLFPNFAFAANDVANFIDVNESDWFYDDVTYVCERGLMDGTSDTKFSPMEATPRAKIVTTLYRIEGTPSASDAGFSDVAEGQYFTEAINWAAEHNIVNGYGDGKFGPNDDVTREQMAAILYRYSTYKNYDITEKEDCSKFSDAAQISSYATEPLEWCVAQGLIVGMDDGTLIPRGNITNAQVATIVARFCKNIATTQPSKTGKYTVTFNLNYGDNKTYKTVEVAAGEKVEKPTSPSRGNYTFKAWYTSTSLTTAFNFDSPITSDITLYAGWGTHKGGSSSSSGSSGGGSSSTPSVTYYVVTFDANGEDVTGIPTSQTIVAGGYATEPAKPARDDYTFGGWYTDVECTNAFDFITMVINANITLYAKWTSGAADDLTDEGSTEVTDNDTYVLSASESEVVAESSTNVIFYVNSTLTVDNFELFCNGTSTGVLLYDDGDFSSHYDDIPNDGCYTGVYNINMSVEENVEFTAKATVGEDSVTTNVYSIFVFYELTDDEWEEMENIDATIQSIIEKTKSENADATEADLISALQTNILEYLVTLKTEGIVENYTDETDENLGYYSISFRLSSGISDGVVYYDPSEDADPPVVDDEICTNATSEGSRDELDSANSKASTFSASVASADIDVDYVTYKESALLLCYETSTSGFNGGSLEDTTESLSNLLTDAGFAVDSRYSVTVDDFKNLQDYAYIHVACHGSYYTLWTTPLSNQKTPVICTPQSATKENKENYSADLKRDRIVIVGGYYYIRPSFFEFYYADDPLKARVVSLGCCKGAYTDTLAESLVDVGASSVLAYTDTVYTAYDYHMSSAIVIELCKGKTVSEALEEAKSMYGDTDLIWGAAERDSGNPNFNTLKDEEAALKPYGLDSQTIHSELLNGNFDLLGLITSKPLLWKTYGDSRTIYKLSGIKPKSSPKMAIISSGFGSLNNETTSAIYQTFLVPDDVTTLSFSYDVVSEEPMEYVGSIFDDVFSVDILNTDGDVLEKELVYESVNTSEWFAVTGIDFPGGDHTTYHTRWKDCSSNVISKYQGQLIVLRFTVNDSGDAIYDTAVLLDSVSVS